MMVGTQREAILRARAQKLAHEERVVDEGARTELITFKLMAETYAVETAYVREVYVLKNLTPIPCTPPFYLGVVNVRGRLCPVIELKRLLGLDENVLTNAARVVILSDGHLELGVVADAIHGVEKLADEDILPAPTMRHARDAGFVRGVTRAQMIVLDAKEILMHPDIVVNEHVSE